MVKRKKNTKKSAEPDSTYFLKLVMYLVLGAQWIRLVDPEFTRQIPIPIGLLVGIVFAAHEHFRIDRKIEFALLLTASFVGFWSQIGIYITAL